MFSICRHLQAVTIPVMAKARIGHFVEAQVSCFSQRPFVELLSTLILKILEALDVDYIDESEVLTPADGMHEFVSLLMGHFHTSSNT